MIDASGAVAAVWLQHQDGLRLPRTSLESAARGMPQLLEFEYLELDFKV
jgi:hypothetical protein